MSRAYTPSSPWRLVAVLLAACLCGCDGTSTPSIWIDSAWHRRSAVDEHLAPILAAAPTPSGAFRTRFLRNWEPDPKQTFGPTVQGRILYALATGHEITGNAAYLEELRRGADFLTAHMIDPENGGVCEAVAADG